MNIQEFNKISIRGRVAYGIVCLEEAIKKYSLEHLDWDFMLKILWSYTNGNVGKWHEI